MCLYGIYFLAFRQILVNICQISRQFIFIHLSSHPENSAKKYEFFMVYRIKHVKENLCFNICTLYNVLNLVSTNLNCISLENYLYFSLYKTGLGEHHLWSLHHFFHQIYSSITVFSMFQIILIPKSISSSPDMPATICIIIAILSSAGWCLTKSWHPTSSVW